MSGVGEADDLKRRVSACLIMAALHMAAMVLPKMQRSIYVPSLTTILLLSVAVCWWALKGVPPSRDADAHVQLTAFASRWLIVLAFAAAALALILGVTGYMHRQALPFFVGVYMFLIAAHRVLHVSVMKTIDEFLRRP